MGVFKLHHKDNYTIISNDLLKDNNLSLKTIGLLCMVFSLPESWDFSEMGLAAITKDGVTAIKSCLKEMEENGYLVRKQIRDSYGRYLDSEYNFYEKPISKTPMLENPILDIKHNKVKNNQVKNNQVKNIYSNNPKLNDSLIAFIEMRKKIKKPLTDKALKILMNKLNSLSTDEEEQIEILEQSIVNCWQSVYPLKNQSDRVSKGEKMEF